MRTPYILVLFLQFSVILFGQTPKNDEWKLITIKEGIKIYTKSIENSSLKYMQMRTEISGQSLTSFVAIFQDLDNYPKWVYSCEKASLVKRISDTEIIYYIHSSFPWPLDDRDFVIKNKVWQDANTKAFHSKSIAHNHAFEKKDNVVRVITFDAEWVITPLDNGKFDLLYTFQTDPGGQIPNWVVNSFMDVGPLNTIKGMQKLANSSAYINFQYDYIQEKKF